METDTYQDGPMKPFWLEWPGRPVHLRNTQMVGRGVGCLFEVGAIIYLAWFCSMWPDKWAACASGLSAIALGFLIDAYEGYMLTRKACDFPVNPCAITVDCMVMIVGIIGFWFLLDSDMKVDYPAPAPSIVVRALPWSTGQNNVGILLLVTLFVHLVFLVLGGAGLCISTFTARASRRRQRRLGGRREDTPLGML